MKKYAVYVPMEPTRLPVINPYEFKDEGQRMRPYKDDGVEMMPLGRFDTEEQAVVFSLAAWLEVHPSAVKSRLWEVMSDIVKEQSQEQASILRHPTSLDTA